jgi:hypothetical protein
MGANGMFCLAQEFTLMVVLQTIWRANLELRMNDEIQPLAEFL